MVNTFQFSQMLDCTLSHAGATLEDTLELIEYAKDHQFYSVIGPRCFVPLMVEKLRGSDTLVGAGCCFPAAHDPTEIKASYAKYLVEQGAKEIDMVLNIGYLKGKMYREASRDINTVKQAIGPTIPLKCIIETPVLSNQEIREASCLLIDTKADYIKTATGLSGNTTLSHIKLISDEVRGRIPIKAAGGIRDKDTVYKMKELGVSRFGISFNNAKKIIQSLEE